MTTPSSPNSSPLVLLPCSGLLAEDLVQEALTKTYAAWPRLRDINNADAYTRKAITTTATSWWRRKSWHNERPHDLVPEPSTGRAQADTEEVQWIDGERFTALGFPKGFDSSDSSDDPFDLLVCTVDAGCTVVVSGLHLSDAPEFPVGEATN
ncbi:MAG: sigma factor [Nocardioidaceae bacterium]